MLEWARKLSAKEHVNASFLVAEAGRQPFPDDTFDIAVSRLAVHHVEDPLSVIGEMKRVCKRTGGRVVIADQISPEDVEAARFHDDFEKFRDPSHTKALRLSEFKEIFDSLGLTLREPGFVPVTLEVDEWATRAGCDHDKIRQLKRMLVGARPEFRNAFSVQELEDRVYMDLQRAVLVAEL